MSEYVGDVEGANFCDFFEWQRQGEAAREDAKTRRDWDALFAKK